MKCTNEDPCRNCDVCDGPGADNCGHGVDINECEICNPPEQCKHGNAADSCERCDEHEDRMWQAEFEADNPRDCKHGISEDECLDCQVELDTKADRARESADWNHFHPSE